MTPIRKQGPPVPRRLYLPLTLYVIWFIANAAFDQASSKHPPDSALARAYLEVFGYRRWLFTWPLMIVLICGIDVLTRKFFSWARRLISN